MIYLKSFNFVPISIDMDFTIKQTCFSSIYPYKILSKHQIERIDCGQITIFYGGNGCGKTTALNIIAEKLRVVRDTLYNKSSFFDDYVRNCKYVANDIPRKSRIITSDDVFDFIMNIRYINDGVDRQREDLFDEYENLDSQKSDFKSLDDYERLKKLNLARKGSKSLYVKKQMRDNVREHSNGESAFIYFTDKIEENALYLLDEPENSLSPEKQQELLQFIEDSVRFYNCQFIIATHSPFILSLKDARIYDFDENPVCIKKWTELKNVRDYYNFFKLHDAEFSKPVIKQEIKFSNPKTEAAWKRLLNRDNYSELGKNVYDRLKAIWDQEDFIVGTMLELNTEEKLQKMLDFLIETGTTDSDDVIPYSIKIDRGLV